MALLRSALIMKTSLIVLLGTAFLFAPSPSRADEASHLKASLDLLEAAEMEMVFTKTIDQSLAQQIADNPALRELEPVMKAFFDKYMSWNALKDDMAKLYAERFTEAELIDITAFYKTPSGKKMAQVTPDLMTKGSEMGQSKVQAHLTELEEMIVAFRAKKAGN